MRADLTAENSIIGSVLIDERCLPVVAASVAPDDFTNRLARRVFSAAVALWEAGESVDPVTVLHRLGDDGEASQYILGCMEVTPTAANVEEYCRILRAQTKRRKLEEVADGIRDESFVGKPWDEIAGAAVRALAELGTESAKATTSREAAANFAKHYMLVKRDPDAAYCRTGYNGLDRFLGGGMFNGDVYILAGRPGMGKTTQGIGIAERVAADGRKVLFISLEMSETQIMAKRIAIQAGINYTALLGGKLGGEEEALAFTTASRIGERPFYIVDTASTVRDIERYAKGIDGLSLIVIDYLGLVRTENQLDKRYEEMTRISADLKALAKRIGKPILVLAQLNRENTQRSDKRPTIADLRDSGAIEQDAAGVIMLHRESYYNPGEEQPEAEEIELIVAKNRHAAPGILHMMWHGSTGQITEIDKASMPF